MATEVVMPQMGESIAEGTITKWLVKVGDRVERDQPLFEISTDKVDAEIPSPAAGQLLEVRHDEGETVAVDTVVALIGEPGEEAGQAEPSGAEDEAAPEPEDQPDEEEPAAAAEGEEEAPAATEAAEEEKGAPREEPEGGRTAAEAQEREEAEAEEEAPLSEGERVRTFSSPVVRKIAAEEGVDLSQVEGTGIHGRVTKRDIQGYLERREKGPAPAAAPASAARPVPSGFHVPAYREGENVEIEPMSKIRQITAAHMAYSKATSAHVTTVFHMEAKSLRKSRVDMIASR